MLTPKKNSTWQQKERKVSQGAEQTTPLLRERVCQTSWHQASSGIHSRPFRGKPGGSYKFGPRTSAACTEADLG